MPVPTQLPIVRWPLLLILPLFYTITSVGCSSETGRDIYVSPEGDDDANGDQNHPVASLVRAAELADQRAEKDTLNIWLAGGTYRLQAPLELKLSARQNPKQHLQWKALPEEHPVISGGIPISHWEVAEKGLWSAPIPAAIDTAFRTLYIGGRRAARARFPNEGYLRVSQAGADDRTNFYFEEGAFPKVAQPEKLELVLLHDWSCSRVGVKSINWEQNQLFSADTIGALSPAFFTLTHWEPHPRYYLENAPEFLDEPGEWYCDFTGNRIYYYPFPNERIENLEAVVPLAARLLSITGDASQGAVSNGKLTFEGITFEHTAWAPPPGGYAGIQACMFDNRSEARHGWRKVPAAIEVSRAGQVHFKDCVVRHTGGSGIWIGSRSKNCSVEACHLYDIAGNGINIGEGRDRLVDGTPWWQSAPEQVSQAIRITHNLVEDCGVDYYGAVGIWGGLVAQTTIERNEVCNLPYTGISVGWMWDTIPTPSQENAISGNHIHHIMNTLSDGGGIYMLGLQPDSRIVGNLIHHVSINAGRAESNGMFLDEGIKKVLVAQNIIYEIARSPLRFHRASTNTVRNNVLMCADSMPPIRYNRTREEDIQKVDNVVLRESAAAHRDSLEDYIEQQRRQVGPDRAFSRKGKR